MLPPRKDRISWDDEFMLQAIVASWRSPDPNTQVGAVVVNNKNVVIGTGYNGFPRGIAANLLPWDRDNKDTLKNKYVYVVHAEKNAIVNAGYRLNKCSVYTTMHPCNECAKDIIQSGVDRIVYLDNPYEHHWSTQAAMKMFSHVDTIVAKHEWKNPEIVLPYLDNLCKSLKQKLQ